MAGKLQRPENAERNKHVARAGGPQDRTEQHRALDAEEDVSSRRQLRHVVEPHADDLQEGFGRLVVGVTRRRERLRVQVAQHLGVLQMKRPVGDEETRWSGRRTSSP